MDKLPTKFAWDNFFKRMLTMGLFAPVVVAAWYFGSPYFDLLLTVVATLMAIEWARLVCFQKTSPSSVVMGVTVVSSLILLVLNHMNFAVILLAVGTILSYVSDRLDRHTSPIWMSLGCIMVGVPVLSLLWVYKEATDGQLLVLWLMGLVWVNDTAAFIGGSIIGGRRMMPLISPSKTWAGALSGLMGAIIFSAIFAIMTEQSIVLWLMMLSVPFAMLAQLGDALESALKRRFDVKDSSTLFPGHGGMLDRTDSFWLNAPLLAWMAYENQSLLQTPLAWMELSWM